jgi:multiple sugar transport system permease protein
MVKKKNALNRRNSITNLLMLLPAILMIVAMFVIPLIMNLDMSFRGVKFMETGDFVGLKNYSKLLSGSDFYHALGVLLKYTVFYTIGIFVVGFITSLMLDSIKNPRLKTFFRVFYVIPYAIPDVVAAIVFTWMLDYRYGVINYLLQNLHILAEPMLWLTNSKMALYTIVMVEIWRQFPLHTLIIYAGLQDVPYDLYEAASLDGAGPVRKFFSITIPYLRQVLNILLTLTVIWSFRRFAMTWLLTKGGPAQATETVVVQIYNNAFINNKMSLAAAEGVLMLLFTLAIVLIYLRIIKKDSQSNYN